MTQTTQYLWKSAEDAQRAGWCAICHKIVSAGAPLVILSVGAGPNDWVRAHKSCAIDSPNVLEKPARYTIVEQSSEQLLASMAVGDISRFSASKIKPGEGPIVEKCPGGGPRRYRVLFRGVDVFNSTNKTRAEGAAELLEQLVESGSFSHLAA